MQLCTYFSNLTHKTIDKNISVVFINNENIIDFIFCSEKIEKLKKKNKQFKSDSSTRIRFDEKTYFDKLEENISLIINTVKYSI